MGSTGKSRARVSRSLSGRAEEDLAELERRRVRAAKMFAKGATQAEVVCQLGVSRSSVSRWHAAWCKGGVDALRTQRRAGRPPRLSDRQLVALERALLKGARAQGYDTDLWTLERVGAVIEERTGVAYHPGHVWKILRAMGWSRQRPARRAVERDDAALQRWVKDRWPRVRTTPGAARPGSSSRTSRASR